MQASPEDVGNIIMGVGTLLVVAEFIAAPLVAPLVMIGKAISSMTSGKKHKARQESYGIDIDRENSTNVDTDTSGSEV